MPSFAGFYVTYEECQGWLREYAPDIIERNPKAGIGSVQDKAQELMKLKRAQNIFFFETVPIPGPRDPSICWGLMFGRRSSMRKEYLAPHQVRDLPLRGLVETELGLKLSEWTVIWYSDDDQEMVSEFLSPDLVA